MANKTIKKTKTATKKVEKKPAKTIDASKLVVAPTHECNCGCHCCCHGHRFIGVCIKIVILCIVFLLGCVASPWFMHKGHKSMMRHIAFDDNGCVVLETVKCPKLLETLATADDNADGCISKAELKAAMNEMHNKTMPEPEVVE